MKHISEYRNTDPKESGIVAGIEFIDKRGGLRPGRITALCGWTNSFKTTLAMNMAVNAARAGVPTLFVPTEQYADDTAKRIAKISEGDMELPIFIEDCVEEFDILKCSIAVACHKEPCPVRFVVIDNIELIGCTGELEELQKTMKKLALWTGAHILFTARAKKGELAIMPRTYIAADNVILLERTAKTDVRVCLRERTFHVLD